MHEETQIIGLGKCHLIQLQMAIITDFLIKPNKTQVFFGPANN